MDRCETRYSHFQEFADKAKNVKITSGNIWAREYSEACKYFQAISPVKLQS